jgi:hypothetical protein
MLDPEFDENKEDIQSSVQRYENMLNQQENAFFDAETLEQIAEHYFVQSRFDQALEAVNLGHPESANFRRNAEAGRGDGIDRKCHPAFP